MNQTITIACSLNNWMQIHIEQFKSFLQNLNYTVNLIDYNDEIPQGNIAFYLSYPRILTKKELQQHKNNIIVHASNLPQGKGWSPATWLILENQNIIPLTLFEANERIDSGKIYAQSFVELSGTELFDNWKKQLGIAIIDLCKKFICSYPEILQQAKEQEGESSYYPKRTCKDSELDIHKTIADQFNLLRVVDNEHYPAFFYKNNKKYIIKIYEDNESE